MSVSSDEVGLRRVLDAAASAHSMIHAGMRSGDQGGDPSVLAYIPRRRPAATVSRSTAPTLQAGFIPPCLPMQAPVAPSGSDWLHEIKHEGYRVIARHDGVRVRLYGAAGEDLTHRYPLIAEAMAKLPPCTIDGTAIACDESGAASFELLQLRRRDDRVFLYAFDLIELEGEDLRRNALSRRKADLGRLLADAAPGLLPSEWIDGGESDGPRVFEQACAAGLAGIVSKRKDSRYLSGRSPYWRKMENPARRAAAAEAGIIADGGDDVLDDAARRGSLRVVGDLALRAVSRLMS